MMEKPKNTISSQKKNLGDKCELSINYHEDREYYTILVYQHKRKCFGSKKKIFICLQSSLHRPYEMNFLFFFFCIFL